MEGCYYWPYVISNDLFLYTLFPLWVIIYKLNKYIFYVVNSLLLVGGMLTVAAIAYKYDLKVGIISFEDYYLFSYEFNKPYTKTVTMAMGMFTALFYMRVLEYRKASDISKKTNFAWLHFAKNSKIVAVLLYIWVVFSLNFITSIPLTANKDAYSWTKMQNVCYYSFGRL